MHMNPDTRIFTTYDCQWSAHAVSFGGNDTVIRLIYRKWLRLTYRSIDDPKAAVPLESVTPA